MSELFRFLRTLPRRFFWIEDKVNALYLVTCKPKITATSLTRHQLGSIDLEDIPEEPTDPAERKNYNGQVSAFFKLVAEPEISRFIQAQLEFIGKEAATWEQTIFARGTINGLFLLREKWEKAHRAHLADQERPQESERFDRYNPISEI